MPGGAQPRLLEAGWRTEGCVHWPVVSTLHVTSSNQYSLRLDQMLKLYDDVFVGFPLCIREFSRSAYYACDDGLINNTTYSLQTWDRSHSQ